MRRERYLIFYRILKAELLLSGKKLNRRFSADEIGAAKKGADFRQRGMEPRAIGAALVPHLF
jgi:hypothetical protein